MLQDIFLRLLRDMCKGQNITQVQLAARLNKPQSYVSKYELGERRLDALELSDVCVACNTSLEKFAALLASKLNR